MSISFWRRSSETLGKSCDDKNQAQGGPSELGSVSPELVRRQTAKLGFAIAQGLEETECPVRNSGPYGFRSQPAVLVLTAH
jgi:hypothetical protein